MSSNTMSAQSSESSSHPADGGTTRNMPLVDLASIDLNATVYDREAIGRFNPHRHEMALLDRIVWTAPDNTAGIASWKVRDDEFWVRGHFPGRPLLPGVLQVEAGAQLAVFLYNIREAEPRLCAFTRIESCAFRGQVAPGDELLIVCKEIKRSPRRFVSAIQGIVRGKICFDAQIDGYRIADRF